MPSTTPPSLQVIPLVLGPLSTNCYIVFPLGGKKALIIDPADSPETIFAALKEHDLQPGAVVLTHGHCDHICAAAALAKEGIPVFVHAADALMLKDPGESGAFFFGFSQEACQPSRLLREGDTVDLGNKEVLRVIHTPGHSPGSICLLSESCAFVGDVLFAGGVGRTDILGGDDEALARSLRRLLELPDDTIVYPGHGPATTIGRERNSNPFLQK